MSVSPLHAFHRHICTLQAFAAFSARPELDRDSNEVSVADRARLSTSLRDWCDDFFDSLSEVSHLTAITIPDAIWMPPTDALRYFAVHEIRSAQSPGQQYWPRTAENVAVFLHIVNHIEWGSFDHDRISSNRSFVQWLLKYFPIYTDLALYDRRECRPMFIRMLTRLYTHPRITRAQTDWITRILLTGGIPACVRNHIRPLLPSFSEAVALIISTTDDPVDQLCVAIAGGDLEYIRSQPVDTLIIPNWQRLMEEASYACDQNVFRFLWNFRFRIRTNIRETFVTILRDVISAANHAVLETVCDELTVQGIDFSHCSDLLWPVTCDTECAAILIQRGCTPGTSLFRISDPATLSHLMHCDVPIAPPSAETAADAISYDIHIAHLFCAAWRTAGLPIHDYLCAAVSVCQDPAILRDLVRIYDSNPRASSDTDGSSSQGDAMRLCLTKALLNSNRVHHVRMVKAYVRLGADINAQDDVFGWTALMKAIVSKNTAIIRFLLSSGASATLPANSGLTALDVYDYRGWHVPGIREMLIRRAQ